MEKHIAFYTYEENEKDRQKIMQNFLFNKLLYSKGYVLGNIENP